LPPLALRATILFLIVTKPLELRIPPPLAAELLTTVVLNIEMVP
jgi:hypothetical protein